MLFYTAGILRMLAIHSYQIRQMRHPWIFLLLFFISFSLLAQDTTYTIVDEMPYYGSACGEWVSSSPERKSCSDSTLYADIAAELLYPDTAMQAGVEGTVVLRFVVDEKGWVQGAEVMRDIGATCGEEALRVLGLLNQWQPGRKDGRPVAVQMHLPVRFKMRRIPLTVRSEKFEFLRDLFCVNYLTDFAKVGMVNQMADDAINPENICEVAGLPNALSYINFKLTRQDGTSSTINSAEGSITPAMRDLLSQAQPGDVIEMDFNMVVATQNPETGETQAVQKEMYRSIIVE